jgi:hypothetical protein
MAAVGGEGGGWLGGVAGEGSLVIAAVDKVSEGA